MNSKIIVTIAVLLVLTIGAIVFFSTMIDTQNRDNERHNLYNKKVLVCKMDYDTMWKILKQQAGVADTYKVQFKEVYEPLIKGRYADDQGTLMKWIQESNPQFDSSMMKKLMTSIEASRRLFERHQSDLVDIAKADQDQHKNFPSRIFLSGRSILEAKIVTSTITEKVFDSGKDDDIELFKKEK